MLRAEVGGLSVAYERVGDGPTVVLLHGFTHDSRAWQPQLQSLPDQFTLIAWDAPGAGHSPDPPETFGIGDWADCLAGFFDAVGVHSAHIVGLSWGGLLAQEFYRRHAARVRSLVLADTYAGWKGSLPEPVPEERLAACLRDASLPPAEFVAKYLPGMFGASPRPEVRDELGRIMADFHPLGFRLMATALARARGHPGGRAPQQPRRSGPIRRAGARLLPIYLEQLTMFKWLFRSAPAAAPQEHGRSFSASKGGSRL